MTNLEKFEFDNMKKQMTPGFNRTPFHKVRRVMSGEIVNEFGHPICSFDIDGNPTAINRGNGAYLEMALNSHDKLLEACRETLSEIERFGFGGKSGSLGTGRICADLLRKAIAAASRNESDMGMAFESVAAGSCLEAI